MAEAEAGQAEQKQKRLISPIIILVLALIFMLWLMLLFTDKNFYDDFGMEITKEWWVVIASFVMVILIIALLVGAYPATAPAPEASFTSAGVTPAQGTTPQATSGVAITSTEPEQPAMKAAVVEAEPLVVEAEVVEVEPIEAEEVESKPLKMKKPRLIEYPKKVPGGVYGDTIVRVDPRTKLNLRTLLIRSCMICDRQGKCWEEIMDTIPRDDFLGNIDCKKGLRKLKGHGSEEGTKKLKKRRMKKSDKEEEEPVEVSEEDYE